SILDPRSSILNPLIPNPRQVAFGEGRPGDGPGLGQGGGVEPFQKRVLVRGYRTPEEAARGDGGVGGLGQTVPQGVGPAVGPHVRSSFFHNSTVRGAENNKAREGRPPGPYRFATTTRRVAPGGLTPPDRQGTGSRRPATHPGKEVKPGHASCIGTVPP